MAAQACRASRRASALGLKHRLTGRPKAQNKAGIAYDGVIRARICSPRNGVHRAFCAAVILRSVCRRWVKRVGASQARRHSLSAVDPIATTLLQRRE